MPDPAIRLFKRALVGLFTFSTQADKSGTDERGSIHGEREE
jgi:hypothetical protein